MTPEQRNRLIETLASGEELSPEWSRILFPPEKREYELVYHGKEREEDIIANTLAVPLQPVRTFNKNGVAWHNKLIFGDNLQAMKTLLEMKRRGELCNADGTSGRASGLHRPAVCDEAGVSWEIKIRKRIKTNLPVRDSSNSSKAPWCSYASYCLTMVPSISIWTGRRLITSKLPDEVFGESQIQKRNRLAANDPAQ
jgi:hypothetical protein